jgi:phenylpropionate dioxygenase-like ring-hydroxylating dioxygenase large terminal subunit
MGAYCTHLGAHLGQGKINGELLQCAFHKRAFDIHGRCQGLGKATVSYPLSIENDMIFAWFGHEKPWKMPALLTGSPTHPESKWTIIKSRSLNFNYHSKAMAENSVDVSHFKIYHHFCEAYELPKIIEMDHARFISQYKFMGYPMLKKLRIPHEIEIVSENIGACTLIINNIVKLTKQNFYFKFFYLATPLVKHTTNYTLCMAIMNKTNNLFLLNALKYCYHSFIFSQQLREFTRESKQIWETKSFLAQPDFTSQEIVMKEFHDWYAKFYL